MTSLIIVQARMSSTRLPGKVLLPLGGRPLLFRMMDRLLSCKNVDKVVVAIPTEPSEDSLADAILNEGFLLFRGHPTDLLQRHADCAKKFEADVVAKIPSDVPLIDPTLVDDIFSYYLNEKFDYVSNLHPATFPDGFDVEVFSANVLEIALNEAKKDYEREHTTPFIWDQPKRFSIGNYALPTGQDYSMSLRVTIDYPEDYDLLCKVYDTLWKDHPNFGYLDVIRCLQEHSEIADINRHLNGVNWYRHHVEDLSTVTQEMTKEND